MSKCLFAASCHLPRSSFSWRVLVHHIVDPVIVLAELGVDGGVSWVYAAIIEPLQTLQLAIAHHHTATIVLDRWERIADSVVVVYGKCMLISGLTLKENAIIQYSGRQGGRMRKASQMTG